MSNDIGPIPCSTEVEAVLADSGLPVSDLRGGSTAVFFGARCDGSLAGVIGIERYGSVALLRSLAVADGARGIGLGRRLVDHVERWAAQHGVRGAYLLTTTAAGFFARLGYEVATRASAPAAIAGTAQFSGLCPASSTFMYKALAADDAPGREARPAPA